MPTTCAVVVFYVTKIFTTADAYLMYVSRSENIKPVASAGSYEDGFNNDLLITL